MTQRYLTVEAAAVYMGITEVALRQRVARRTLPFIKDRKTVRFDKFELDKAMSRNRVPTSREVKRHVSEQQP